LCPLSAAMNVSSSSRARAVSHLLSWSRADTWARHSTAQHSTTPNQHGIHKFHQRQGCQPRAVLVTSRHLGRNNTSQYNTRATWATHTKNVNTGRVS
jgi:hypothetical protein